MTKSLFFTFWILLLSITPSAIGNAIESRTIKFYHTHTGKSLDVTYFQGGEYVPGSLEELNIFLADWRNGHQHEIDPGVLDILWDIQRTSGNFGTFEVISAYRSEETNSALRKRSKGVAKNSQHVKGKAIDVRLRGMETSRLRDIALELERGGVGYYAKSDFVHVDTGRVRRW